MALKDDILNDLQNVIEEDLGNQTFTWKGKAYTCIPSTTNQSKELSDYGGFADDADLILQVRTNQFLDGVFPVPEDLGGRGIIIFAGDTYRLKRIAYLNHNASIRLFLINPTKGL